MLESVADDFVVVDASYNLVDTELDLRLKHQLLLLCLHDDDELVGV